MNKKYQKIFLLVISLFITTGCEGKKEQIEKRALIETTIPSNVRISKENAKAIKTEIIEDKENLDKIKVTNISNFNICNLSFEYQQFDNNNNPLSKQNALLDITLFPSETAYLSVNENKTKNKRKITSYSYESNDKKVVVDILNDKINILNKKEKTENQKEYDILQISSSYIHEKGDYTYYTKIKNISNEDLGNIVLTIAELNDYGEYIRINNLAIYEILKSNDEKELKITLSKNCKNAEIIGYTYDSISKMANIKVDRKTDNVYINKN